MPHTVRRRVCAIRPTTSPTNVWNVGAVKHGRNTARRPASEHGTVAPGSIDRSLSRGGEGAADALLFTLQDPLTTRHRRVPRPTDRRPAPEDCETRDTPRVSQFWVD